MCNIYDCKQGPKQVGEPPPLKKINKIGNPPIDESYFVKSPFIVSPWVTWNRLKWLLCSERRCL